MRTVQRFHPESKDEEEEVSVIQVAEVVRANGKHRATNCARLCRLPDKSPGPRRRQSEEGYPWRVYYPLLTPAQGEEGEGPRTHPLFAVRTAAGRSMKR